MILFWYTFFLSSFVAYATQNKNEVVSKAFKKVSEFLSKNNKAIEVINVGDTVIDKILRQVHTKNVPHVYVDKETVQNLVEIKESAVIILQTTAQLESFNNMAELLNYSPKKFYFLVYCQDATINDVKNLVDNRLTEDIFQFEYFLVDDGRFIRLMTFVWYTPKLCGIAQLVEVNKFSKKNRDWQHEKFKIDKFENLHGCTLHIMFPYHLPEYQIESVDNATEKITCIGYFCRLVEAITESMNF